MNSIYNLADLLKSMEKFEEAEKLFREHLTGCDSSSMLSMSFPWRRYVQKKPVSRFPRDGDPLRFSEFSADGWGLPRYGSSWRRSRRDREFHGGLGGISRGPVPRGHLTSDFEPLEINVSKNPTCCRSAEKWTRHRNFGVWLANHLTHRQVHPQRAPVRLHPPEQEGPEQGVGSGGTGS